MERVDGTRWSWRSAFVCAAVLGNICLFIASLIVLVLSLTKQPSLPPQVSAARLVLNLNDSTSLTRGKLDWFYKDVEGAFLGPSFEYGSQELTIKEGGLYCIYAQISAEYRGSAIEKARKADFYIRTKTNSLLTLNFYFTKSPYTNSTSQIFLLSNNERLYGTLNGTTEPESKWALTSSGNFFGVFRIN